MPDLAPSITRTLHTRAPSGDWSGPITLGVSLPRQEPGGEWSVAVSMGGIEGDPAPIRGEGGWQAVSLGMRFVAMRLVDLAERDWVFEWTQDNEPIDVSRLFDIDD